MAAPIVHINSFSSFDHVPRSGLQVWGTHIVAGLGPQFTKWTFRLGHLNGGGLGKPTQIDPTSQLRSHSALLKCYRCYSSVTALLRALGSRRLWSRLEARGFKH